MDRKIVCKGCGVEFTFSERDQNFYKEKGYNEPQNCKDCRVKRKQDWEAKQKARPSNGGIQE